MRTLLLFSTGMADQQTIPKRPNKRGQRAPPASVDVYPQTPPRFPTIGGPPAATIPERAIILSPRVVQPYQPPLAPETSTATSTSTSTSTSSSTGTSVSNLRAMITPGFTGPIRRGRQDLPMTLMYDSDDEEDDEDNDYLSSANQVLRNTLLSADKEALVNEISRLQRKVQRLEQRYYQARLAVEEHQDLASIAQSRQESSFFAKIRRWFFGTKEPQRNVVYIEGFTYPLKVLDKVKDVVVAVAWERGYVVEKLERVAVLNLEDSAPLIIYVDTYEANGGKHSSLGSEVDRNHWMAQAAQIGIPFLHLVVTTTVDLQSNYGRLPEVGVAANLAKFKRQLVTCVGRLYLDSAKINRISASTLSQTLREMLTVVPKSPFFYTGENPFYPPVEPVEDVNQGVGDVNETPGDSDDE